MPDKPVLSKQERRKKYRQEHRKEISEYNKNYRLANHEKITEQKKQYYQANPEKVTGYDRKYRLVNRAKIAERQKEWRRKNQDSRIRWNQRRRSRKRNAESTLTAEEWKKIVDVHFGRCHYCGVKSDTLHQEHIVPLSKGGGYTAENIVPACQQCNSSKGAKSYHKFPKESKDRLQLELEL